MIGMSSTLHGAGGVPLTELDDSDDDDVKPV